MAQAAPGRSTKKAASAICGRRLLACTDTAPPCNILFPRATEIPSGTTRLHSGTSGAEALFLTRRSRRFRLLQSPGWRRQSTIIEVPASIRASDARADRSQLG